VGTVAAKAALCVLLLAIGLGLFGLLQLLRKLRRPKLKRSSVYAPERGHDKRIAVRGWSDTELAAILRDFEHMFREQLHQGYRIKSGRELDGTFRLSFPNDIEPELYCCLLNALIHPTDYELEGRAVAVLGRVRLSAAFTLPDPGLRGRYAWVYLPEDDRGYELVFVEIPGGPVYEHDFVRRQWQPLSEACMPAALRELSQLPWPD
jgi:hypothetical protein